MLEERMKGVAPFEPILRGMDLDPVTILRAARSLRRHKAQAVLALMKKDVRQTMIAARTHGIPAAIRHSFEQPLIGGIRGRMLYGGSVLHLANAEATRRTVLASAPWLEPSRVSVIYNGIDASRYADADPIALDVAPGSVCFGLIANLGRRKGVEELARAWHTVAAAVPNGQLVIAGKGGAEERFRQLLGDAPRVHWLGYRKDIPQILSALDVLVLPSHYEGAPNVVLEAMAASVAVIATGVSGTPELVRDDIEARLIPPRDADALAAAMIELAHDPETRRRFAEAGHARALDRFTIEGMLDRYEEFFSRLIATR
jgi:glycosyltransferase involved in cell wall biosynthesis